MLFGCSADKAKPLVNLPQVHSVHLKSFSVADKEATFYVALYNPNDFSIPVSGVDGSITLNQLNIGKIDVDTEYTITGGALKTVVVPISFDSDAFQKAAQTVLKKSTAEYHIDGAVKTSFGNVPFTGTGDLSTQEILRSIIR